MQGLFRTQEQLIKFYSATLTFKCRGSTAVVPVFKYLFTLVKAKDSKSVLKSYQKKNIFQLGLFAIIYINHHGTAW